MKNRKLLITQLEEKLQAFKSADKVVRPSQGWVHTVRNSLGMSLEQLGRKLSMTRQSAQNIEKREREGSITLKALNDAAKALDMKLVYGFVPNDGSLDKLIEKRANQIATEIVLRTSGNMKLEDQQNTPDRIKKAIEERTQELMLEMPKILWD